MEKKCSTCKKWMGCEHPHSTCNYDLGYPRFEFKEKIKPKLTADDFNLLKNIGYKSLILDGVAYEMLVFYAENVNYLDREDRLQTLLDNGYEACLLDRGYIKQKEREPKVGEVWQRANGYMYLILDKIFSTAEHYEMWNINKKTYAKMSINIQEDWKFICNSQELLKPLIEPCPNKGG